MTRDEMCFLSAVELRDALRARELSPVDVVDAVLDRIDRVNPAINAFVTLLPEQAREQAQRAERELDRRPPSELGALHGIPVVVKDLTPTAGVRTTYGSVNHADSIAEHDSLAWSRMKAAGAILIGKTTTPDFGMLGVTQSTLTGTTNNPWDASRTAGGSSGGSAAAVVAGLGHLGWGSDGGGSIRIPAACCGAVGLKASIGRIPGFGEAATYETVGTAGPITRRVADAALLLGVTAGPDIRDPIALPALDVDPLNALRDASLRGVRIAYSADLAQGPVSRDVQAALQQALAVLRDLGATVQEVTIDLPDTLDYFMSWWAPDFAAWVDSELAAGADPASLPPVMKKIAEHGRAMSALDLHRVNHTQRPQIAGAFADVFASHDLMITPTMPLTAFPHPGDIGGNTHVDGQPIREPSLNFHRLTEPFSHAGLPAISVPCGFDDDGMPFAMQIAGPYHADLAVLRAAAAYEAATPWTRRHPMR